MFTLMVDTLKRHKGNKYNHLFGNTFSLDNWTLQCLWKHNTVHFTHNFTAHYSCPPSSLASSPMFLEVAMGSSGMMSGSSCDCDCDPFNIRVKLPDSMEGKLRSNRESSWENKQMKRLWISIDITMRVNIHKLNLYCEMNIFLFIWVLKCLFWKWNGILLYVKTRNNLNYKP